eukprot:4886416-Pyramimonas_sp.AAC.1
MAAAVQHMDPDLVLSGSHREIVFRLLAHPVALLEDGADSSGQMYPLLLGCDGDDHIDAGA